MPVAFGFRRLRSRVTFFFLLAALPVLLISLLAVWALDALIADVIHDRAKRMTQAAQRILEDESRAIAHKIDALAEAESMRHLQVHPNDARTLARYEALAIGLAQERGLDLLAIARTTNGQTEVLSSAHLPESVGDPAPPYLRVASSTTTQIGYAHALVSGNPPKVSPALVAMRRLPPNEDGSLVTIYGGTRLDQHRLLDIARMGDATVTLRSPGLRPRTFSTGKKVGDAKHTAISLKSLPHARTLTQISPSNPGEPTVLEFWVHAGRLEQARKRVLAWAIAFALFALLLAFFWGSVLSRRITRPILALSRAAEEVGQGRLETRSEVTSHDEVGTLVRVFNQMTVEIAESRDRLRRAERIAAWQEIARRVAHEIKNPLFPIQMSMETLRKSHKKKHPKFDEIVEESTRAVLEEVQSLNRIVTEFSDFARLPRPKIEPVSVRALLGHVHELYANRGQDAQEGAPSVTFDAKKCEDLGLPPLSVDRGQISRALINLIKNALEALDGPEGSVALDARPRVRGAVEGVELVVSDNGPGISEEIQEQLFTPYFTTKSEGTGLGLAIVERIVTEHQGVISLDSGPAGTTFVLWLPSNPTRPSEPDG